MSTERRSHLTSAVAPAPSLQEVLDADGARLGRVDFGLDADAAPLGTEAAAPVPAAIPEPAAIDETPDDTPEDTGTTDDTADQPLEETGPQMSPPAPTPRRLRAVDPLAAGATTDPERAEAAPPAAARSARPTQADYPGTVGSLGPPESQLRQLGLSVDQVAASVIARMREAGEANRRHLEALEAEAARRCELLTAQAELDAELIRLHARREAHAIIAAARTRVGDVNPPSELAQQRIEEVTESFAHFSELFGAPLEEWGELEGLGGGPDPDRR